MSPIERIAALFGPDGRTSADMNYWFMTGIILLASVLALFYGRRFFWILAYLLGFLLGQIASQYIVTPLPVIATFLQLALGVVFGLLASALQWPVAYGLAFLSSGMLGNQLSHFLDGGWWMDWLAFLAAGIVALLIMRRYYAESLIVLSVLVGAGRIVLGVHELYPALTSAVTWIILALLILAGLAYQAFDLRRERRQPYLIPASAGGIAQEDAK